MKSISVRRLIISAVISLVILYFSGLWEIRADNNIHKSADVILSLCQIFILTTFCYFNYCTLLALRNSGQRKTLIAAALLFIALWFYFMSFYVLASPFDLRMGPYITIGNYLAHTYGINWFWMDWQVWVQCISVYSFGFCLYLATKISILLGGVSEKRIKS